MKNHWHDDYGTVKTERKASESEISRNKTRVKIRKRKRQNKTFKKFLHIKVN